MSGEPMTELESAARDHALWSSTVDLQGLLFAALTVLRESFEPLSPRQHAPFNALDTLLEKAQAEAKRIMDLANV